MCTLAEFGETEALPGGLYLAPKCKAETEIGTEQVTVYSEELEKELGFGDLPLAGKVYNMVQPEKLASYYGVALAFPKELTEGKLFKTFKGSQPGIEKEQYYLHTFVKGNVEWGKEAAGTNQGDYHDYFEVEVNPEDPLISSRQVLYGTSPEGKSSAGKSDFITNATSCPGDNTTFVTLKNTEGATTRRSYTTPIGLEGCGSLLFEPNFKLTSGSTLSDQPNELTTEVSVPNNPTANAQSQVKSGTIALPEGMTLNPSAAHGLEACTVAQARIHSEAFGVACPAASEIGTVSLEVPTLPAGSFTGSVYLGGPVTGSETGPITGPPYIVYVVANSTRYGISVRIKGEVEPNLITGQLKTAFRENPEQPFTNLSLHFNRGVLTAIANPLVCGTPTGSASFVPVTGTPASKEVSFGASVTGCASSLPFSLSQGTANQAPNGGEKTSYTVNIERADGQQYLSRVKTVLPEGLVGLLPTVTKCPEPQASKGECAVASKIGVVRVKAGAGPTPYEFNGNVYLTGPYGGAPFGLSIVVPAVAGPFNLGNVITRGTLNVEPYTARVVATSTLPTIVGGIPLRLKQVVVNINKQGFLINPTNCGVLATETTLTSTMGATQALSTPFQVSNCNKLAFKPAEGAATGAKTSKANGASLETTINVPSGDANVKSVVVQLPKQLPSRLTTLQKACPEKTFAANPYNCPPGSFVGGVRANTPTLAVKLTGPAILVSHGGAAFPDLDLLLEGEGVRVILVGNTNIKNGITTTTFAAPPDVPVTSITVNLPTGSHSALTANGNVCAGTLKMPTTIVSQNGITFKQNTTIRVNNCPVRIVGHKTVGSTAYLTVQTYSPGRISGSGSNLATRYRNLKQAQKTASLQVPLSRAGQGRGRPLRVKIRVGFVPKKKGAPTSVAYTDRHVRVGRSSGDPGPSCGGPGPGGHATAGPGAVSYRLQCARDGVSSAAAVSS